MMFWILGQADGWMWLLAIPAFAIAAIIATAMTKLMIGLALRFFIGATHKANMAVRAIYHGSGRVAEVGCGLVYIGGRRVSRPVIVQFERVERWVTERVDMQIAAPLAIPDAAEIMGLTGNFTKVDLDKRYRAIMDKVHPDHGGTEGLAKKVNAAKEAIMAARGWK